MVQKHIVQLVDDIDESEAVETVVFSIDGASYEIDLSAEHAEQLRDALALYIAHARRVSGRGSASSSGGARRGAPTRIDREQTVAIREWARSNGHAVGHKGRIPGHIIDAYNASV
ncbi:Lsr2 family protein [Jatrophihabitans sp.]|uniref:histone-like nucleoid-structuring protein Lsr2 n=1 Tax=Jatrophihabitans sp. TaxID=1932789 RepID=UPI0030C77C59|nr:hypothetical protein [Jatrophihabitans sp.]